MSRTKIVATIGPVSANPEMLSALAKAGMSIARLNGSHNSLEWHAATVRMIREVLPNLPILLDIPGRKLRTIQLAHEPAFALGETVVLTTDVTANVRGKVPVNYPNLHADVKAGHTILADDGTLRFTVLEVRGCEIICRAETAGTLRSRKGINVPFVKLSTPLVSDRDRSMMKFVHEIGVDFVGISFVESAAHVSAFRDLISNGYPRIVSKIENRNGFDNMDEIIAATDAVMIDRGDLSVETSVDSVGIMQKQIISASKRAGKPVIVATEMLHTMIENDFPTKAEVSDITNAVLDGCSATMLSGETAVGAHPVLAVDVMRRISEGAEAYLQDNLDGQNVAKAESMPRAIENAISLICRSLPITKIVAITRSGFAAQMIAVHQVRQPILAVSDNIEAARGFNLLPGVEGVGVSIPFLRTSTDHIIACIELLWRMDKLTDEDVILVTAVGYPRSGNRMNLIQTHHVKDLRDALGWAR
jgi:pyruvate kinase